MPDELERSRQELLNEVTTLWLTDRARTTQPTPTDEVKTTLYFVGQVFWTALPEIYDRLDAALEKYYPGTHTGRSWLKLASWIGGDRDGNPNVTASVTAEALHLHRGLALENYRRSMQELSRRLSLSAPRLPLPQNLRPGCPPAPLYPPTPLRSSSATRGSLTAWYWPSWPKTWPKRRRMI